MKTFVVLAVSIVLVSIFFSPIVMAVPPIPSEVQIVEPDPSLPKELAAFSGKWEGETNYGTRRVEIFIIVEKIDEEKANLYSWRSDLGGFRFVANVTNERGKYKIWFRARTGQNELTLRGNYLDMYVPPGTSTTLRRVL